MLKFSNGFWLLSLLIISVLVVVGLSMHSAGATDGSAWISETNLSLRKIADAAQSDIPTTFFGAGNIDCTMTDDARCAINTNYGLVYNSSLSVNGKWMPILDYGGNGANFLAVPNSTTALTTSSGPVFGNYLYFTHDAYGALAPKYKTGVGGTTINGIDNLLLDHYQLSRPYDNRLQDKTGSRLAADLSSLAFSGNSQWMMVTDPNITTLRVDVSTGDVLPFGKVFTYGFGSNPKPKNAISSDGRWAVIASQDSSNFSIYDLSTCGVVPDSISQPVACQTRDLITSNFISTHIPGYSGVQYLRFIDDNTISFYASYQDGAATKYGQYLLSTNSDPLSQQQYLALGDSYISGEGAFDYTEGTDTSDNLCHVSLSAYPFLIGKELNYDSYHSVACSGATTEDIINTSGGYKGQVKPFLSRQNLEQINEIDSILSNLLPGYIDQLDFVKKYRPEVITISVGGDDMGFSSTLQKCIEPWQDRTCYSTYEDRLELVRQINTVVFPNLVKTYNLLKQSGAPGARIYAIGYPQIALPGGDCAVNVWLDSDEITFSKQIIDYLDSIVKLAADKAGVYYVDTQDALVGHRLCETKAGDVAINGITAGNDFPDKLGGPIGRESYHPNPLGYQLLEASILSKSNHLTAPMPSPNPTVTPPPEIGLDILDAPHSGRQINTPQYDPGIAPDLAYRGAAASVSINGADHSMASGFSFQAQLHSDPIILGNYQTGVGGNLTVQVPIPATMPTGYHSLHFYGQDVSGQSIDIYKTIYIANTADDMDGDGVDDSAEACVGVPVSNQDYDKDGVDDACDAEIAQPADVPQPSGTQVLSRTTPPNSEPTGTMTNNQTTGSIGAESSDDQNDISLADVQPAVLSAHTTSASVKVSNPPVTATVPEKHSTTSLAISSISAFSLSMLGVAVKRRFF